MIVPAWLAEGRVSASGGQRWAGDSYSGKHSILYHLNKGLVVCIDSCSSDVASVDMPVVGVVLPDDGSETKGFGNIPNTVVDVTEGRLRM